MKGGDQAQLPFVKSQKCGAVNCSVLVRTAAPSLPPSPPASPWGGGGGRAHHLRSAWWTSRGTNASVESHHGPCHTPRSSQEEKQKNTLGETARSLTGATSAKREQRSARSLSWTPSFRKRAAINRWVNDDEGSRTTVRTVARHPLKMSR